MFAQQADIRLIYSHELIVKIKLDALQGQFSVENGLAHLIAYTPLCKEYRKNGYWVVRMNKEGKTQDMKNTSCSRNSLFSKIRTALLVGLIPATATANQDVNERRQPLLEEIVVTAQKRSESVQDVPIAITAMTGEMIEKAGLHDLTQLKFVSPSVAFTKSNSAASSTSIKIRGVGTSGVAMSFEGAVGVYIDGVYRSRPGSALNDFLDLEGLEVLRGPQGTLFGKNTAAGAVILRSSAPDLTENYGNYTLLAGDYGQRVVKAVGNLVVSENSALRLAGTTHRREGFIESADTGQDYNDVDRYSLKAQYLLEPNDDLSIRLIGDFSEASENCCYGTVITRLGATAPLVKALSEANGLSFPLTTDWKDYKQSLNFNTDQTSRDRGVTLHVDWDAPDGGTFKSITSYRKWNLNQGDYDADFVPAELLRMSSTFSTKWFSQELLYNGILESLPFAESADFIVGVHYSNEELDSTRDVFSEAQGNIYWNALFRTSGVGLTPIGLTSAEEFSASDESVSIFTHWNFSLSDAINLTAGLRYSSEEKTGEFENLFFDSPVFDRVGLGLSREYDESLREEAVTGTVSLQYKHNEDIMTYATYSRGFKAGGINLERLAGGLTIEAAKDPTYDAEFVDNYELGIKADYWGGRARTNAAVFYTELTDMQFAVFEGTRFRVFNAADAISQGVEIENIFFLMDDLKLNLSAIYLDTKFGGDAPGTLADRDFEHAPSLSASAAIDYNWLVSEDLSAYTRLAANYNGEHFTNSSSNGAKQEAVTLLNFTVGLNDVAGKWDASFWCQNCTDERYIVSHFNTVYQRGTVSGFVGAPRQYGVTLTGHF